MHSLFSKGPNESVSRKMLSAPRSKLSKSALKIHCKRDMLEGSVLETSEEAGSRWSLCDSQEDERV